MGMPDPNQPPYPGMAGPPGGYPPAGVRPYTRFIYENACLWYLHSKLYQCHHFEVMCLTDVNLR